MMTTLFLLQFLGLFFMIMGLAGLVRTRHFITMIGEIEHSYFDVFVVSSLRIMMGLVFVLQHNLWGGVEEGIVSLFGWLILALGVLGMFFPQDIMKAIPALSKQPMRIRAWMMISFVIGIAMSAFGFGIV